MRGRLGHGAVVIGAVGLIPASAGQTGHASKTRQAGGAHPRECGADYQPRSPSLIRRGSSPRVRGRQTPGLLDLWKTRLIPASAGQTHLPGRVATAPRAHPRECGADCDSHSNGIRRVGSSPRVRGRQGVPIGNEAIAGLIPASAGQTNCPAMWCFNARAHPRECGADPNSELDILSSRGSSPRVRGRLMDQISAKVASGLIPASAGQTAVRTGWGKWCRAHPRECGADDLPVRAGDIVEGSSPRVRGRRLGAHPHHNSAGLIPASAGQTVDEILVGVDRGAHPRECGADLPAPCGLPTGTGSSPRVRGRL